MTQLIQHENPASNRDSYTRDELLECAHGRLFGTANGRLPLPNMLMFDRITQISAGGGVSGKGYVEAELDITSDLWFFACHFETDPVMPGCLGLDALWQLLGFFLSWRGNPGRGRALGVDAVRFTGQVLPQARNVSYQVDVTRLIERKLIMGIGDGRVLVDGRVIYTAQGLRVGLFTGTAGF